MEVAIGADLCTIEEVEDFLDKVPEKQPFMATSSLSCMVRYGEEKLP